MTTTWAPLLSITGSVEGFDATEQDHGEAAIVRYLVDDDRNPGNLKASVEKARENLRSCREVVPREAWSVVNDLHLYVQAHADDGVGRRSRARFLARIIRDSHRLSGILSSTMNR